MHKNLKIPNFVTSILLSFLSVIALVIILSAIASLILINQKDPLKAIQLTALCILYFSSFTANFITSKFANSNLICSLISGLMAVIVMLTGSGLQNSPSPFSPLVTTILISVVPILTTLGSALGKADSNKRISASAKRKKLIKKYH